MPEQRIRSIAERAHAIWEAEGRPDGRHEEHWRRAEQQLAGQQAGSAKLATPAAVRAAPRRRKDGGAPG